MPRVAGGVIGVVFGIMLCWSGMSNPDVIREALLLEAPYLFLMFGSAVLVAQVGQRLLRRRRAHALLTGAPVSWTAERPGRRHVVGSLLFGVGWGVADACPGRFATQVGQGIPWRCSRWWARWRGCELFLRRGSTETEPETEPRPTSAWIQRSSVHDLGAVGRVRVD